MIFPPMSIQNFPKNPKIALRKSCDEAWHTSLGDFENVVKRGVSHARMFQILGLEQMRFARSLYIPIIGAYAA